MMFVSLHVESHALIIVVLTLKIPSISICAFVWTHLNTACIRSALEDGMWVPSWHGNRNGHTHNVILYSSQWEINGATQSRPQGIKMVQVCSF